jgi:hypothetical protein
MVFVFCSLGSARAAGEFLARQLLNLRRGEYLMLRFWKTALLGAALMTPVAIVPTALRADDHARKYQDKAHNDEHEWNSHEDKAYRMWAKENHRKYRDFSKLKENDQQSYWGWRHEHSDSLLKIDIH